MKLIRYNSELGTTATCTNRLMEETKGLCQRALKGSTRDFFLFGSWFSSKKSLEKAASIGVDLIGMVKTNTKGFCKAMIEGLMKDWPSGYYIVLSSKTLVPGERTILDIGYKYITHKFLLFDATVGVGITT